MLTAKRFDRLRLAATRCHTQVGVSLARRLAENMNLMHDDLNHLEETTVSPREEVRCAALTASCD